MTDKAHSYVSILYFIFSQ